MNIFNRKVSVIDPAAMYFGIMAIVGSVGLGGYLILSLISLSESVCSGVLFVAGMVVTIAGFIASWLGYGIVKNNIEVKLDKEIKELKKNIL